MSGVVVIVDSGTERAGPIPPPVVAMAMLVSRTDREQIDRARCAYHQRQLAARHISR